MKIFELKNGKWQIPENVNIKEVQDGNFEINIAGNVYIIGSGSIVNVLSIIENHL